MTPLEFEHWRRALALGLCAGLFPLSACQVFFPRKPRTVTIETTPPGAVVTVGGIMVGTSPCPYAIEPTSRPVLFEVLPPRDSTDLLIVQRRAITWREVAEGSVLYFDLRIEAREPVKPFEIRHR